MELREIIFGLLCVCVCVCVYVWPYAYCKKNTRNYEFYEMFVEEARKLHYIESRC